MKKKTLIILGILIVVLGVIGISYALWTKVLVQSGENIVNADCFELTFLEEQGIPYPLISEPYPLNVYFQI